LHLLYCHRHQLDISTGNSRFTVNLVLETDEHQMHHSR
jgi:hypothetical protein